MHTEGKYENLWPETTLSRPAQKNSFYLVLYAKSDYIKQLVGRCEEYIVKLNKMFFCIYL